MAQGSDSRPNPIGALMARLHRPVYESRLRALVAAIAPRLPASARVLDVGCGGGLLGRALMDARPGVCVEGLERFPRPNPAIPVTPYDGRTMPFSDRAYDAVIVADVLHHEEDPHRLLSECVRVSRGLVIIKDHCIRGPLARSRIAFIDWAANAPYGVKCLYRYNTLPQWRETLTRHRLSPVEERTSMNLYPPGLNLIFGRRLQYLAVARRDDGETNA